MITDEHLKAVGTFLKPHGIEGEITLQRDYDDLDFGDFSCLIVDMDGIYVPFFIDGVRPKGSDTDLVSIDGIGDETHAALLTNKTAYVLRSELAEARRRMAEQEEDGEDEDGFYAEDFIGFSVETDQGQALGRIVDIDDSTANFLFVIETEDSSRLLIPIAGEFIHDIDRDRQILILSLPEGLLEL